MTGDTLAVGAMGDSVYGLYQGAVYLITDGGNGWADVVSGDVTKLSEGTDNISLANNDGFGRAVALAGGTLVVGASNDGAGGGGRGAVYLVKQRRGQLGFCLPRAIS